MTTTRETPQAELARIEAKFPDWAPERVLEAMGHPGYGRQFARRVLAEIACGADPFNAVYANRPVI